MNDNPYPNASDTMHYELHTAWDEGYAEGFAAGRAAATPDPAETDTRGGGDASSVPDQSPAASPDERLREAARVLVERSAAAVCQPGQFRDNVGEAQWRLSDAITATRAALAADREAPVDPKETTT